MKGGNIGRRIGRFPGLVGFLLQHLLSRKELFPLRPERNYFLKGSLSLPKAKGENNNLEDNFDEFYTVSLLKKFSRKDSNASPALERIESVTLPERGVSSGFISMTNFPRRNGSSGNAAAG